MAPESSRSCSQQLHSMPDVVGLETWLGVKPYLWRPLSPSRWKIQGARLLCPLGCAELGPNMALSNHTTKGNWYLYVATVSTSTGSPPHLIRKPSQEPSSLNEHMKQTLLSIYIFVPTEQIYLNMILMGFVHSTWTNSTTKNSKTKHTYILTQCRLCLHTVQKIKPTHLGV